MKALANNISTTFSESGQQLITLALTAKADMSDLKALCADKKLLTIEVSQQKRKRSLDANSYAWVLIGKIADIQRTSKDEVYIEMLKSYGQREPQLLSVISEGVPMIYRATQNHCCEVGESELKGKVFKHLAILIGSSQYDTKAMSILIEGIVSEAKDLDIEVMTPNQLAELKSSWKGVQ